jgi:hypothetical protein
MKNLDYLKNNIPSKSDEHHYDSSKKIILPIAAWGDEHARNSVSLMENIINGNKARFFILYFTSLNGYLQNKVAIDKNQDSIRVFIIPDYLISLVNFHHNNKYYLLSLCQSIAIELARITGNLFSTAFADTYYSKGFFDQMIEAYYSSELDIIFYGFIHSSEHEILKHKEVSFQKICVSLSKRLTENVLDTNSSINDSCSGYFYFNRNYIGYKGYHYNVGLIDFGKLHNLKRRFYGPIDSDFYLLFDSGAKFTIMDFDKDFFCASYEAPATNQSNKFFYSRTSNSFNSIVPFLLNEKQKSLAIEVFERGFSIKLPQEFFSKNVYF